MDRLDYSTISNESLEKLSNCDSTLLSDISSRCYSAKLNSSFNSISESLNLALAIERLSIFKKVLKDSEPFASCAREYSQLVDSLSNSVSECKDILDLSMSRSNTAAETIAKTLEYAEKMALKQLISGEIIDKFHILEPFDSNDIDKMSFDEKIQKLNLKAYNCIESIATCDELMLKNRDYKALKELIQVKNLELDTICESLFTILQDLIKDYSTGSQNAESFFETIYLKDSNLPFNKSLFVLSHRKIYFSYIIEHLARAKVKRLAQMLSMARFDSINHFLAYTHEIREEYKGFISALNYIKQSQKPLILENTNSTITDEIPNANDNPLQKVLEEKLITFTNSEHLKSLRLLTFYIDKYKAEEGPIAFFLEIFEKIKTDLSKEFESQIDQMDADFVRETLCEIESGPGITACESIDNLVNKFKDKLSETIR